MNFNKLITFIDIEASGLDECSYPIEIGWADTLGNSDSFLIRPPDHWTYWNNAAEAMHGIKREKLLKEGIPVTDAAERLDRSLGVETVFCDALEFDSFWIERLFKAAGIEPSFQLYDVHQLFGTLGAERAFLLEEVIRKTPAPHRAREDAQRYVEAYCAVIANRHL